MKAEFARALHDGKAGFPDLLAAVEAHLDSAGVPFATAAQIMIAIDEVVSNALDHGARAVTPVIDLRLSVADGSVEVEICDDGRSFDPLSMPPPDTTRSLDDREIGGLGIHFLRELMTEVSYRRDGERNRLRFSKTYPLA